MQVSSSPKIAFCKHCHSIVPNASLGDFCCQGCETVYGILSKTGLGEYYQLKENAVCFTNPKPIQLPADSRPLFTAKTDIQFFIEGIHCSACLWLLEKLPMILPKSVSSCVLNVSTSVLHVKLTHADQINEVAAQIREWGYLPHLVEDETQAKARVDEENRKRLVDLGIAGALAGNVMLMSIPLYSGVTGSTQDLFEGMSLGLSVPALFYSGRSFFKNVYAGIRSKTFPIDGPILLALLVAFFYSTVSFFQGTHQLYFDSLTALIFLLLSSRYYLARLRQSSAMNLGALDFFQSEYSGKVGDRELLKAGTRMAFDGVVRQGSGWFDQSQFTGESEPVKLQAGDPVYAGTLFVESESELVVEVLKIGTDTKLAQLLKKVSEVQMKRTATEIASDRWSKVLLVIVTNIALFAGVYFYVNGQLEEGVRRILALLIVTCPCALALATPLVFTLAMKSLLKKGLLVKDPVALDRLADLDQIYFDKTGTLTEGRLSTSFDFSKLTPADCSALYSMARLSRHPVSRAIEREIVQQRVPVREWSWKKFEEKTGTGLFAELDARYSLVRCDESGEDLTQVSFLKDKKEIARISLQDHPRSDSLETIQKLAKRGFDSRLLSGDHRGPVKKLADQLSIENYHYRASPEEKAFLAKHQIMVGDGVNDSLALSQADVSVAVQGGMESAIQSAQVYSMKPGISLIVPMVDTAKAVRKTLQQNFALSTTYNLIGAVLSLTGYMNPLWAAVLMPMSALTVFWSSLYRMRERES